MSDIKSTGHSIAYYNIGTIVLAFVYFLSQYVFNDTQDTIKNLEEGQRLLITKVAQQEIQMSQLIFNVQDAASNRYTSIEARAINNNFQRQIDALDNRIDKLEQSRVKGKN